MQEKPCRALVCEAEDNAHEEGSWELSMRGILIYEYIFILHMTSRIIPVRLRERELKWIDQLVKKGIFRSRSEAIRELLSLGIENLSYLSELSIALERLFELEKSEGEIPIDLSGATRQLLEERER